MRWFDNMRQKIRERELNRHAIGTERIKRKAEYLKEKVKIAKLQAQLNKQREKAPNVWGRLGDNSKSLFGGNNVGSGIFGEFQKEKPRLIRKKASRKPRMLLLRGKKYIVIK